MIYVLYCIEDSSIVNEKFACASRELWEFEKGWIFIESLFDRHDERPVVPGDHQPIHTCQIRFSFWHMLEFSEGLILQLISCPLRTTYYSEYILRHPRWMFVWQFEWIGLLICIALNFSKFFSKVTQLFWASIIMGICIH